MTSLQRAGAELLALVVLIGLFLVYWNVHNRAEQKMGARACLQSTTETKTEVKADAAQDASAQALQLALVVQTYDAKVADLSRSNADLAARLHDGALRQNPAANPGRVANGARRPLDVPEGQDRARAAAINAATRKVFDDCDADYAARVAVTQAYNEWRDRMIAAQK